MAGFNTNLNNLFSNFQKKQKYSQYKGASKTDKENMSLWNDIDLNGDGKITSADRNKISSEASALKKAEKLFDVNGDGKFDQKDVDMFLKGDVNGDGKVTQQEKDFVAEYKTEFKNALIKEKTDFTLGGIKYVKGKKAEGLVDGKFYKSGKLGNGVANEKQYVNGNLANGFFKDVLYKNGDKYTGLYAAENRYYKDGKLFTGKANGVEYNKGVAILYVNNKKFTGVYTDNKKYKDGKLFDGKENGITYKDGVAITIDKIPEGYNSITNIDFSSLRQSSVGECGPLSTIMSLYATEKGKQAINDAVKIDSQGNYIVTFADAVGNKKNYVVTKEEIQKYDTNKAANGSFAVGDNAILAIELANAKADGTFDEYARSKDGKYMGAVYDKKYTRDSLLGRFTGAKGFNQIDTAFYGFSCIERAVKKSLTNPNMVMMINIGNNNKTINCVGTPSTFKVTGGGHFIAITGVSADGKTVTLTDPVDGSKQYKVTIEELKKITGIFYSREI